MDKTGNNQMARVLLVLAILFAVGFWLKSAFSPRPLWKNRPLWQKGMEQMVRASAPVGASREKVERWIARSRYKARKKGPNRLAVYVDSGDFKNREGLTNNFAAVDLYFNDKGILTRHGYAYQVNSPTVNGPE
jgi:hypothetical protein